MPLQIGPYGLSLTSRTNSYEQSQLRWQIVLYVARGTRQWRRGSSPSLSAPQASPSVVARHSCIAVADLFVPAGLQMWTDVWQPTRAAVFPATRFGHASSPTNRMGRPRHAQVS
eukprot:364496-Chlamydomonas_euryale.AAC.18